MAIRLKILRGSGAQAWTAAMSTTKTGTSRMAGMSHR